MLVGLIVQRKPDLHVPLHYALRDRRAVVARDLEPDGGTFIVGRANVDVDGALRPLFQQTRIDGVQNLRTVHPFPSR